MDENDWVEHYRKVGEHVALVDIDGRKVEGPQWLGAQKFIVAENNRRHMEPIIEASRSREVSEKSLLVSWLALLVAVGAAVASLIPLFLK